MRKLARAAITVCASTAIAFGGVVASPSPAQALAIQFFGEVERNGAEYFCVLKEPWVNPTFNVCVNVNTDYTNDQDGLNLSNVGTTTFPGAISAAVAFSSIPAVSVAAATLLTVVGCPGVTCSGSQIIRYFISNPGVQSTLIGWSIPGGAIGSAGPYNRAAETKCAVGKVVNMVITWDGDIHADLGPVDGFPPNTRGTPPSVAQLINQQNVRADMIAKHPALVVEIPVWDRPNLPNLADLRGHQIVRICGQWVTDTNSDERWNELHPISSLSILSDPDTTGPVVNVPHSPLTAEARGPEGAIVTYSVTAVDAGNNLVEIPLDAPSCSPASGSTFPIGVTTVDCAALSDWLGNRTPETSFVVTVQDTIPPETTVDSAVDSNGAIVTNGTQTLFDLVTVSFSGTDLVGVAGFECSLDDAAFLPCSSPVIGIPSIGPHNLRVRAFDAAGNRDPTPAQLAWTVITPSQAAQDLQGSVRALGLARGVEARLLGPLHNLATKLGNANTSNDAAACGKLRAFLNIVSTTEASGRLNTVDAEHLRLLADNIKVKVGCAGESRSRNGIAERSKQETLHRHWVFGIKRGSGGDTSKGRIFGVVGLRLNRP